MLEVLGAECRATCRVAEAALPALAGAAVGASAVAFWATSVGAAEADGAASEADLALGGEATVSEIWMTGA